MINNDVMMGLYVGFCVGALVSGIIAAWYYASFRMKLYDETIAVFKEAKNGVIIAEQKARDGIEENEWAVEDEIENYLDITEVNLHEPPA